MDTLTESDPVHRKGGHVFIMLNIFRVFLTRSNVYTVGGHGSGCIRQNILATEAWGLGAFQNNGYGQFEKFPSDFTGVDLPHGFAWVL